MPAAVVEPGRADRRVDIHLRAGLVAWMCLDLPAVLGDGGLSMGWTRAKSCSVSAVITQTPCGDASMPLTSPRPVIGVAT